jgi:hypothetical protein
MLSRPVSGYDSHHIEAGLFIVIRIVLAPGSWKKKKAPCKQGAFNERAITNCV